MTNNKRFTKVLSSLVCFVLITAMALTLTGCQDKTPAADTQSTISTADQQTVGFTVVVVDADGNEKSFDINTTEKTVGAALLKEGLIEGEDGDYGLYVTTVNGITADYNVDGTYWAFYIGGQYASTGVDATDVVDGETYTFKVEK